MNALKFSYRRYRRPFRQPLMTRYGQWRDREGLILRLESQDGRVVFGEIAPISWMGSETLEDAIALCDAIGFSLTSDQILQIPDDRPACQFGFGMALDELKEPKIAPPQTLPMSGLLPAGELAISAARSLWESGYHTLKWKIGTGEINDELQILQQIKATVPTAIVRLDANGSLTYPQAQRWLDQCDRLGIEFLEQPLPPEAFNFMQALAAQFHTPIALDESVTTIAQLQQAQIQGWRGIFVIKPAIAGFPHQLRQFCQTDTNQTHTNQTHTSQTHTSQTRTIEAVFSSALETAIARRFGLQLAAELGNPKRAVGYGTAHWFQSTDDGLDGSDGERVWQSLWPI